ncbi:MAG: hypothetical protein ACC656_09645, partial [Candidatus Heimdallarchaeota archaeon]
MSNFRGKQVIDFSIIQEKMLIETSTILENLNVTNKEYVESLFNNSIQNLDYWPYDRHLQALDSGTNGVALATDQAITSFPQGQVKVKINGVSMRPGTTTSGDYYFSADSGQTSVSQPAKGDLLYWNGELAEFKLETTDNIDFIYVISEDEIVWNTEIQHNNNTAQVVYILDDIAGVANRNKIVFNPDIWLTAEPNVLYWDTTNENFVFNTPQQFINRTYGDFQYRITYDGPSLNTIGSIIGQQFSIENLGQNTILFTPTYHWDASTNNEMAFTGTEIDEWYDKTGQLMLSSVNSTNKPTYDSSAQGVRMNNSNFRIRNLL